nr:type VI secretion system baseplate subunit TssK [Pantoea agglomerans]
MSVQNGSAAAGEGVVQERPAAGGIYASLFEKINLTPVAALSALDTWQDAQAMSEATADERLTAGMQVFLECLTKAGSKVEKLDKHLIDHHIAELDWQISRQLDAVMHHEAFQATESLWRGVKSLVDKTDFRQNVKIELLDMSKEDLRQDFEDSPEIIQSGLYKHTYIDEYDTPGGDLHLRFPDGTLIDTDNADDLPPVLALEDESQDVVVVLALPLMRANGGNCLKPDEVAERPVRYRQCWRDVRNIFGEDTRQIAVMQPVLTLRFAHQDNSDYLTCPVARLQQDSQGGWALDDTWLPPLLALQGSRWLVTQLEQLMTQLRARLSRLMNMRRESNERMADFAVADVSLFWLLNALNSAEPVLSQFQRHPQSPAERLYPELARLAGSLLTFSLEHQVSAIPVWQHEQLNNVFPPLFDLLGDLLEASLPSRVVAIELEHDARLHFWQARLHDPRLREGADYYLSVRSPMPVARLQEQFPRQCKAGSPDHVRSIVNSSRTASGVLR